MCKAACEKVWLRLINIKFVGRLLRIMVNCKDLTNSDNYYFRTLAIPFSPKGAGPKLGLIFFRGKIRFWAFCDHPGAVWSIYIFKMVAFLR